MIGNREYTLVKLIQNELQSKGGSPTEVDPWCTSVYPMCT